MGGPATGMRGEDFIPGKYLKPGYVITSRGCSDNSCWFCTVPQREGPLRELPIRDGWNVLDDNLLACSEPHIRAVFKMLERQKAQKRQILFTGGLEAARIREWHIDLLKKLRPKRIFFGCDTEEKFCHLQKAMKLFKEAEYCSRNTLYAYVLIGYPCDTFPWAEQRLQAVLSLGLYPMAMLYRDTTGQTTKEWRDFQRVWARPAIIYAKNLQTGSSLNSPQQTTRLDFNFAETTPA
jgi:hypothetical protein